MNVIPQYKVIGPYNYDKIIDNIKKKFAMWFGGLEFSQRLPLCVS